MPRLRTEVPMKLVRCLSLPVLVGSLALGAWACGDSTPAAKTVTTTTTKSAPPADPPPATDPPEPKPAGMGSTTPDTLPPVNPIALSDEQIAAITGAANRGEVEQSKLAQSKTKDPKVKKFAAMMITHHGEANQKQIELLKKQHLTPEESPTSTQLTSESSRLLESLKSMTGAEFDRAYVDAQVKEHTALLDAMDTKLLPAVKNADLKADITAMRAKLEGHLKEAQSLQKSLPAATK